MGHVLTVAVGGLGSLQLQTSRAWGLCPLLGLRGLAVAAVPVSNGCLVGMFLAPLAPQQQSPPRAPAQPRRRRKQLKEIARKAQRLATCWEKLYALHVPQRGS